MKNINKPGINEQTTKAYQTPSPREGWGGCEEGRGGCEAFSARSVCECNRAFHAETLHPMVSLIDMSRPCDGDCLKTDCYAVKLRHWAAKSAEYGWRPCDFTDATLLCIAPDKEIDLAADDGTLLIFHPDLVKFTPLGARLREYSFFKYRQDEALHMSCCEERVIKQCFGCIGDELCRGVDEYSKDIISNIIDLLLNYCRRFYNRQFITRHEANVNTIAELKSMIDVTLRSGEAARKGMPTAARMAARLGMSAGYLDDMLKNETGKSVAEHVQLRRLQTAKELLVGSAMPVGDISSLLGFCTEQCFATVFRKATGCTPEEYRGK